MRRAPLVLVLVALLTACAGGGGDPEEVLAETADKLGEIRSGDLDLSLIVRPRGGEEFGFELRGPFELPKRGRLPRIRVEYTQVANGRRATVTLVSDGREAHAEAAGRRIELTAEQQEELRSAGAALAARGGLGRLPIDAWLEDPELSDGGEVGGAETDKIEGKLDPVATVNGLVGLARGFGRGLRHVDGASAEQLREATESSRFEVYTGKDDRLLRRLLLEATLGFDVPSDLRRALGEVVGATITFRLGVGNPNEPVNVQRAR